MPPTGTRHSPVPRPITWYRKQRFWLQPRIIRGTEGADQCVGQQHAPYGLVGEGVLEDVTDRPLDKIAPGLGRYPAPQLLARRQRLGQRWLDDLGEGAEPVLELAPGREFAGRRRTRRRIGGSAHPGPARPEAHRRPPANTRRSAETAARDRGRAPRRSWSAAARPGRSISTSAPLFRQRAAHWPPHRRTWVRPPAPSPACRRGRGRRRRPIRCGRRRRRSRPVSRWGHGWLSGSRSSEPVRPRTRSGRPLGPSR